jgi:hypothetical protein
MAQKRIKHKIRVSSILKGNENLAHFLWEHKKFVGFMAALVMVYMFHGNAVKKTARKQQELRDTLAVLKTEAMATTTELLRLSSLPEVKKG